MGRTPKVVSKSAEKQLQNIGKRLTQLRKEKGFTNYEIFAYENKISRSQYGKYEKGADMQFTTIIKICEAHGISLKEFFSEGFD
jgi:transcriptional regulator with XRE-family HTH domain